MSPVVRRFSIAILQFLLGSALLYLAARLYLPHLKSEMWVDHVFDASSFGRDWWMLVLAGLGVALVLLALPSPWSGDRPAQTRAAAPVTPSSNLHTPAQLDHALIVQAPSLPEVLMAQVATPVVRPPEASMASTPSFRSKPLPPRPRRRLVVTGPTGLVQE